MNMFDLSGKPALITGASGGIGAAIARALHAQGATVVLSGTREAALAALARELGERAHVCPADLSDPAAPDALIEAAEAAAGPLAVLVNNAGLTRDMLALRMGDEDWNAVLEVDLAAPFRLARTVLRGMLRRRAGRIISISSIVGATGNAGQANYAAAKAGLVGMSKALAQEVASRGVTVNVVAPGLIQNSDDGRVGRGAARKVGRRDPPGPFRPARGRRRRGGIPGLGRGGLGHRRDPARERRHGDDLADTKARPSVRVNVLIRRENGLFEGPPGAITRKIGRPVHARQQAGTRLRRANHGVDGNTLRIDWQEVIFVIVGDPFAAHLRGRAIDLHGHHGRCLDLLLRAGAQLRRAAREETVHHHRQRPAFLLGRGNEAGPPERHDRTIIGRMVEPAAREHEAVEMGDGQAGRLPSREVPKHPAGTAAVPIKSGSFPPE